MLDISLKRFACQTKNPDELGLVLLKMNAKGRILLLLKGWHQGH